MNLRDLAASRYGTPDTRVATEASASARAARAADAGLVRLETTHTRPFAELERIKDARRRSLRLFKSLSCSGDFLKDHRDEKGRVLQRWFITLTYRPDVAWSPNQIRFYVQCLRAWCNRRGVKLRYVWCAEQHESGRIHYHAIIFLRRGLALPKPDKSGMWPHGMSQREFARKGVGYLMKYASKTKDVSAPWPKGLRLHANGGLDAAERVRRTWWCLPRYAREFAAPEYRVRRAPGGGWWSPVSGNWWPAWVGVFHSTPLGETECAA